MIIYSERILAFLKRAKNGVKEILEKEAYLRVGRDRFYFGGYSYPIHLVIYQSKNVLGFFNAPFYEIGLNEALINAKNEMLKDVLRHEIAHYLTYIQYGEPPLPHGPEFKKCCIKYGWGEGISKASICLEILSENDPKDAIFRKVQKLLALSSSSSTCEAEAALIKSRSLLLKYNIEQKEVDDERFYLLRVLKQKRKTSKMDAIGKILETFFVNIVYHKAKDGIYLEIIGEKANVEIAEYVAKVLENELETLWENTPSLIGRRAKNSFFMGVAKGYCDKIERLKKGLNHDDEYALLIVEGKLMRGKALAYKRLSSIASSATSCNESTLLGQRAGKNLSINPAINTSKGGISRTFLLID